MTTITAETILRSRHAQRPDKILSTLLLRYPRPIHAEFMTHRVLSKNSASSRAMPVKKLILDVIGDPFIPLHWGKNEPGMQANEEHDGLVDLQVGYTSGGVFRGYTQFGLKNEHAWLLARDNAVQTAQAFADAGYHKQIVNRLLEPFAHITVVCSGTEWTNFRALRDHPAAEPHIQILAREIGKELDREDNIQTLHPGGWHMPFITDLDDQEAHERLTCKGVLRKIPSYDEVIPLLIKKSVACCASTSYKTVDGFDMTLEKAIELHDKLVGSTPLHASPAEHVAQADELSLDSVWEWQNDDQHANFSGFRQYRKMLPNESL